MISALHNEDLYVIADFPLGGVSANHVWAQDGTLEAMPVADGTIDWDSTDSSVQNALKEAIVEFVDTYQLDGIRLHENCWL